MEKAHKFTNKEIIVVLKEVLAALEVKDGNRFKIRAYQNVITSIESLTSSVFDLWEKNRLSEIPGVGFGIEKALEELFEKGKIPEFEMIKHGLPEGMFSLIGLRGIGAKKAFKLATAFSLHDRSTAIEKLVEAAQNQQIRHLESFGEKSEKDILDAVTDLKKTKNEKKRMLLIHAEQIAERVLTHMKEIPEVIKIDALGSLRRRNSTVGDLDIVVATNDAPRVLEHFKTFSEIEEILVEGDKKVSVNLKNDVQVDIRTTEPAAYGAMLQYSTGSKAHNVLLRTYSLEMGMSISEYGIKEKGNLIQFENEQDMYAYLKLDYVEPEIRLGKDEINLARTHKLPNLVQLSDIKGEIHTHTIASDGVDTLEDMVKSAIEIGYEYIGISDHSPSVQSRGHDEVSRIVDMQRKKIDAFNSAQDKIKVLYGYEVNILSDGTLGLPDEFLSKLDYGIASIHTSFTQDRNKLTERICNALKNPYITMIGHPSSRLINERDPIDVDWDKIFDACVFYGKYLEINSQPNRLDLADDLVYEARKKGVRFIINTDSHEKGTLSLIKYGIDVARRGMCEKTHILNTLGLNDFIKELKSK